MGLLDAGSASGCGSSDWFRDSDNLLRDGARKKVFDNDYLASFFF